VLNIIKQTSENSVKAKVAERAYKALREQGSRCLFYVRSVFDEHLGYVHILVVLHLPQACKLRPRLLFRDGYKPDTRFDQGTADLPKYYLER